MHNNISLYSFQPAHHKSCRRFASCLSADSVKNTTGSPPNFSPHSIERRSLSASRFTTFLSRSLSASKNQPLVPQILMSPTLYALLCKTDRVSNLFLKKKLVHFFSWCSTNNRDCPSLLSFCRAKNSAVQSPCMLRKETFPKTHHPL